MQDHLIELCVGDTLQVGRYRITLLQVEGDELSVEVMGEDDGDSWTCEASNLIEAMASM